MVKEQLEMYRAYQRTIQTLFTICGCWYMPTESGKSRYYWSICMILGMIIYMTIGMNTSYVFRHNLVHFMKSLSIMIAGISAIIKVRTKKFLLHFVMQVNTIRNMFYA